MKNKDLLLSSLLWEGIFAKNYGDLCEFFFLQILYEWVSPIFALRYHYHKQIAHDATGWHHTYKYIPKEHSSCKRLIALV